MESDERELSRFAFLEKAAKDLGAIDAKAISASQVFVENRVPLKCRTGCIGYGKKLTCPPFVPTADEFRKILSEYRYALRVNMKKTAEEAGMAIKSPVSGNPTPMALLLID